MCRLRTRRKRPSTLDIVYKTRRSQSEHPALLPLLRINLTLSVTISMLGRKHHSRREHGSIGLKMLKICRIHHRRKYGRIFLADTPPKLLCARNVLSSSTIQRRRLSHRLNPTRSSLVKRLRIVALTGDGCLPLPTNFCPRCPLRTIMPLPLLPKPHHRRSQSRSTRSCSSSNVLLELEFEPFVRTVTRKD